MKKLTQFHTDKTTADALIAVAKDHLSKPMDGHAAGMNSADVTTQYQDICQFRLTTNWKNLSATNFVASGEKIVPLKTGAIKRAYPTTIYAFSEPPTSAKGTIIVAHRRANKWVLLPTGESASTGTPDTRVRLVQPKELFPACEYKSLQDVYSCILEYSDDDVNWGGGYLFDIVGGRVAYTLPTPDEMLNAHKYWRLNLKGFAKPEDPNDPHADRGFYTFGRLWETLFYVERKAETKKTVDDTEYTFSGEVSEWQINTKEPVPIELTLSEPVENGTLFYRPNTSQEWIELGSFTDTWVHMIPTVDLIGFAANATIQKHVNTHFYYKIEVEDEEFISLTLRRPTYSLSPAVTSPFTVTEPPVTFEDNGHKLTVKLISHWSLNGERLSVDFSLDPPVPAGQLHYRAGIRLPFLGGEQWDIVNEWTNLGEIYQQKTVNIPIDDFLDNSHFEFAVSQGEDDIIGVIVTIPNYPVSPDCATVAMPPPHSSIDVDHLYFDSKPVQRKSQNHRIWQLTFDEPEVVTKVMLDVDQHLEHYIVCPGGRDQFKQDIPFIYSFDLASEKWTATTFPEMQKPMFNMDAKVVELADKTHQLIVLSGQVASGFSNIIQGYNFEKDYVQNVVDTGNGGLNFAGRPALVGDPMLRNGFVVNRPSGESDFLRSLIVVGGSERSCFIRGSTSAIDSVLFSVQGSTLAIGMPYETTTLNISLSNTGHTGLPFGFFDYRTYASQAGAVGNKLQNLGTYTRHQNLPVRGILRRRPLGNTSQPSASNPVIDFLLIGGFNQVGREAYNNSIVSGIFNSPTASAANSAQYSMLIQNAHFSANNMYSVFYYPDCDNVLGDCCAEYIEERDEVICFGGRANESDTAAAHDTPSTLVFEQNTNAAAWNYSKYPLMPHPRWSAASVLIKDLQRNGESEPCDRIFIIGGRNREGFVAEVDVFNLTTNAWESDWKGLDQGELENYTPSGGGSGGTTINIIQGGGNNGLQTVKAGDNITITGDSKNPVISARLTWG